MSKLLNSKRNLIIFVALIAVIFLTIFMTTRPKDVTDLWKENDVLLSQRNYEIAASYQLAFKDTMLIVSDRYFAITSDDAGSENTDLPLEVGEYTPYTINQRGNVYTIKSGKEINYRLTQIAPRIFVDEIGTEYITDSYVDDF